MKNLLVTTDFSSNSKSAIKFAMQVASQTGAEIVFYHTIELLKPTSWSKEKNSKFEAAKKNEFTGKLEKFVLATGKGLYKDKKKFIKS